MFLVISGFGNLLEYFSRVSSRFYVSGPVFISFLFFVSVFYFLFFFLFSFSFFVFRFEQIFKIGLFSNLNSFRI
jgi:hypothetical protein